MITPLELKTLKKLQRILDDVEELQQRFYNDQTNYTQAQINEQRAAAKENLTLFFKSITEPSMTNNESFSLKASIQTYELSVVDLQKLIGEKLGVPDYRVTVTPKTKIAGDGADDRYSVFDGLTIVVKNV